MKKFISILLCAVLLLSLFGCGSKAGSNALWDEASPETSAMQLFVFDQTGGRSLITFDQSDEHAILDRLSALDAAPVTDWAAEKITLPVYGIEIGTQDGRGILAAWSNGYLILRDGSAYRFDFDFSALERDYKWEPGFHNIDSLSAMPCGRLLSQGPNGWIAGHLSPTAEPTLPEGITMTLKEQAAETITVELANNSGTEWCYGEYFSLNVLLDGVWYDVPVLDDKNYAFTDIGIILPAGSSQEETYNLSMYGTLPDGRYRLVVNGLSVELGRGDPNHLDSQYQPQSSDEITCVWPPRLNFATLLGLTKRYGEKLTWEHFNSYECEEIGSGLHILCYPIDADYQLLIGGPGTTTLPFYIRLVSRDDPNRCVEVRTGDVEAFLQNAPSSLVSIIDHSADSHDVAFAMALEPIWEDDTNVYYFSCIKSSIVTVYYADGTEEDVKTALQAGRVTMDDLDAFGIHYYTEPKA